MDDKRAQLERDYCPPIDTSLFSAIVLDYDLSDPGSCTQLCATLDEIKVGAQLEEQTSFDPSGSSGGPLGAHISEDSSDRARSWRGEQVSSTSATEDSDLTSTSQDQERVHLENFIHDESIEKLSEQEQRAALLEMFPDIKPFDVDWIFKKTHYNFGRSVEGLLNQAFLQDETENGAILVTRGVDGFSEPAVGPGRRKKKGRKSTTPADPFVQISSGSRSPASRWERVKEDVDFIEQRTFILRDVITSYYHRSGASLSSTIAALMSSEHPVTNPTITEASSSLLESHTFEIAPEFPSLSYADVKALVQMSHPSKESARELARSLISSPLSAIVPTIVPQYLPRPPSPEEVPIASAAMAGQPNPSRGTLLADKRSLAFAQAQSAYRKSKSNPHFGGAAAYYSQIGRDASDSLRKHESTAADQLVASQSHRDEADLHGVNVRDAVRISRIKVKNWWEAEAREWSKTGKAKGDFRVVTGQGHHSTGGKGVLGPAVFKALLADGWKVRMEQGYIVISGKTRTK